MTYHPVETPTRKLWKTANNVDQNAQRIINSALDAVATEIAEILQDKRERVTAWLEQLPNSVSEEEFYDAIKLLARNDFTFGFRHKLNTDCFNMEVIWGWYNQEDAPPVVQRRPILQALFLSYLDADPADPASYITEHINLGRWTLSSEIDVQLPSFVTQRADERWQVADVVLPLDTAWDAIVDELPRNQLSVSTFRLIEDLQLSELLCKKPAVQPKPLRSRLQMHKGIGARKARQIEDWLQSLGCEFIEESAPTAPSVIRMVDK